MGRTTETTRQDNRRRLLDAAAAAFAEAGIEAANINDISLAAGLGKGTVYNYFPSKEALFLAVVDEACALAAAGADRVPPHASTRERLRAALASDLDWVREHEPFAQVLVRESLSANSQFYPRVVEAAAPFVSKVATILRDGVSRGDVRTDLVVDELALLFTGLQELALVQYWGSNGAWPPFDAIPDFVVKLFLEGVVPRPAPDDAR